MKLAHVCGYNQSVEIGQQSEIPVQPALPAAPVGTGAEGPAVSPAAMFAGGAAAPLHTQMQSTLAPTSEYVRYLLLALPARYVPRGIIGALYETKHFNDNALGRAFGKVASWFQTRFHIDTSPKSNHARQSSALAYNAIMGVGSLAMTASYSHTVYKDIKNIFAEAVGEELGKPMDQVDWSDLKRSNNRIVQKTIDNFFWRTLKRGLTDLLFFPAALARSSHAGDLMVGTKAALAFGETWKRKTTMFEDLVTFINNKINPRNGLGQTINVGEIFDLYQHYNEAFHPDKMFTNVLERGTGEGARWAASQPIFQRMTELMNLTYAYKHSSVLDPQTGHAVHQANFALPKFIYLLGHDLIDVNQPERTMAAIEIANRFGIGAVKEMQVMLQSGVTLAQVTERFPIPARAKSAPVPENGKNGVIAKGSTRQLDRAPEADLPATQIDVNSIRSEPMVATAGVQI